MKLKETQDGFRTKYESVPDDWEKRMVFMIIGFWVGVSILMFIGVLTGSASSSGSPYTVLLVSGVIVPIFIFGIAFGISKFMGKTITIDPQNRKIMIRGFEHIVSENAVLTVKRECYRSVNTYSTSRNNTYSSTSNSIRQTKWTLNLDQDGNQVEILNYYAISIRDFWVAKAAEKIAEAFQLTLIDKTGVKAITREVGQTDMPLREYLRTADLRPVEAFNLPEKVSADMDTDGYTLRFGRTRNFLDIMLWVAIFFLLTMAISIAVAGYIVPNTIAKVVMFVTSAIIVVFMLLAFNATSPTMTFTMSQDTIKITKHGKLIKGRTQTLNLSDFELLQAVELWDYHTVEFVGDERRYLVPGAYNYDEATDLRNLLQSAIRSYCL